MKHVLLLLFGTVCVGGIDVPDVGILVDPSGSLRPVQGVAGNFLVGVPAALGILSAACAERLCLAKTDSKILSAGGETDAPPGPAIFGLDGKEAIVYFLETHSFARWRDGVLDPLDWAVDGEVLSIRVRDGTAEIAVRREEDAWIIRPDGAVVAWIALTRGPVLLLTDGVLFAMADSIVFRRADGAEFRFSLPGTNSIAQMGPHYAAVRAGALTYALRTDAGRERLFLLPAAQGEAP